MWPAAHDTVQASIHLSTPFMDASFELSKAMSGAKRQRERWPRLSETRVLPLQTFQKIKLQTTIYALFAALVDDSGRVASLSANRLS